MNKNSIIIVGKTTKGQKFRPSDWHYRLASNFAEFSATKRLIYSEHVQPIWIKEMGVCGVMVDQKLAEIDPIAYNFLERFALANDLVVCNGEDDKSTERNVGCPEVTAVKERT